MGTIYLARLRGPAGFRRLVALKRAHQYLVRNAEFTRMFLTEARLASRLHHPNVVAVHDVEELHGELILVMDYVRGGALSSLLSRAEHYPLDPAIALRIILDAAAGLDAAHELTDDFGRRFGLVHRDISPENVLVGTDGVTRISDFGVAKTLVGRVGGSDGRRKGKLAYMAPECAERGRIDARTDIFALGAVAWEALTSKPLFRAGNEVETMRRVLRTTPQRPSELRPGLPPALDDVVLRALEKAPDARWPTAGAFAGALEAVARESGLTPATHAQVGAHVHECFGHVLRARHRVLSIDDGANEMPADRSGVRTAISPAECVSPSTGDSTAPTTHDGRMTAPRRKPSFLLIIAVAATVLATAVTTLAALSTEVGSLIANPGRPLEPRRETRVMEVGGSFDVDP